MGSAASGESVDSQPRKGAWVVLAMLCFVYVLNFLDRQLLSILSKPIQDSLGVTDGQLGLIGGLYFALFYCLISIPVGWLADRTNRSRVLALACALWSAATMACGLARTYPQLVAARMTVGVGEAGGVPPSYAIISDYFPPGRRATALSLFNLGPAIGQALGVAFGAGIAAAYSWRHAFLALGSVGVVTALAVLMIVREPPRGGMDPAGETVEKAAFWPTVRAFFGRRALVLAALGGGVTQIVTYGSGNFTTLMMMREKGMTLTDVATWSPLAVIIGMGGGIAVSGPLIDWGAKRWKQAYALLPAISLTLAVPFYIAFTLQPAWPMALALSIGPTFLNYYYLSSSIALMQEETPASQRVLSGALMLLIMNLTGMGVGPTLVGWISDQAHAAHPGTSLQIAFLWLLPFYGLAILIFLILAGVLKRQAAQQKARA